MDVVVYALLKSALGKVSSSIAESYDTTKTYGLGSLIVYENQLYKCINAVTIPEDFDESKWQLIDINTLLQGKADLIDGKVPALELPSYVSDIIEVETYEDLPNPGQLNVIYVVKTPTVTTYRWTGSTYIATDEKSQYYSVKVDSNNIITMSDLRTYINNINNSGLHCFFDFSDFITNAYICTVLVFTQSNVNYCLIFDVINGRTFINYAGYQDNELVQDYVNINEDNLIRAIKITDSNTTLADINDILSGVDIVSHHVMFDVSALNADAYLCSILCDGISFKVMDIVSQKVNSVAYNANTTLLSVLQGMSEIVDTGSDQTISGIKMFESGKLKFATNSSMVYSNGTVLFSFFGNEIVAGKKIEPSSPNSFDLGSTSHHWKDLYLSGSLKDGTNSISVADIANGLFNVINASDIVNNTLTQAQYNLITNGKPTRIIGTFLGYQQVILLSPLKYTNQYYGLLFGGVVNENPIVDEYHIDGNNLKISITDNEGILLKNIAQINGKWIPSYPSSPSIPQVLKYLTNNTMAWENESGFKRIDAPSSAYLSQEQIDQIINGVVINDNFLGYRNPVFFTGHLTGGGGNDYVGVFIASTTTPNYRAVIGNYRIRGSNNQITAYVAFDIADPGMVDIPRLTSVKGKEIPNYPANTGTFNFKQVNGTLSWLEQLYGESFSNSTTELTYEKINNISISADKTFTLKTAQTNCIPTYEAIITNTSSSAIVLTFTGVSKINTNDSNITIVNNTLTLPGNTTIEVNIFNGNLLAYNWNA